MVPPVVMATATAAAAAAAAAAATPVADRESHGADHCNPRSVARRRQDAAEQSFLRRYYELHPLHHHRLELYATL
uniref:Putative secreted protein n=1 Tax=Anopheles triannulatus TaxID=58253 RepID=A0A2M4B218_9DIPT